MRMSEPRGRHRPQADRGRAAKRHDGARCLRRRDHRVFAGGVFVSWNRRRKLYGYTAEEQSASRQSGRPPEERESLKANWERILRGERVDALESRRVTKDGRLVVVATTLSPIIDPAGRSSVLLPSVATSPRTSRPRPRSARRTRGRSRRRPSNPVHGEHEPRVAHPLNGVIASAACCRRPSSATNRRST